MLWIIVSLCVVVAVATGGLFLWRHSNRPVPNAKTKAPAKGTPITLQAVAGNWEGGEDGDIKKREALFGEDGKGQLRVFIVNATMNGSIRYDFSYQIDPKENLVRLTNDYGGKTGVAELAPDKTLHFQLEQQDCVLTRPQK